MKYHQNKKREKAKNFKEILIISILNRTKTSNKIKMKCISNKMMMKMKRLS